MKNNLIHDYVNTISDKLFLQGFLMEFSNNKDNKLTDTSTGRRFSRTFESKLFPHFSISNSEKVFSQTDCTFISEFKSQINKIKEMINSGKLDKNQIIDSNNVVVPVSMLAYRNPTDKIIAAISSYGIEKALAYQVFRMVYGYSVESVNSQVIDDINGNQDKIKVFKYIFNLSNFREDLLNPLSRLHFKYAIFLEKEEVLTAVFAKPEETPSKYRVTTNVPTPTIVSEIYVSGSEDGKTLNFRIPDIFNNTENYFTLTIKIDTIEEYESYINAFCGSQNVFLSIFKLNLDGTMSLKIEELSILNDFFLNRRSAIREVENNDSEGFYKMKLEEIAISMEKKVEYSEAKSRKLTNKRKRGEENIILGIDEEDYSVRISRSKQVMYGIKNKGASV